MKIASLPIVALALAAIAGTCGSAAASTPSPLTSTSPTHITLVGHVAGSPDAGGTFEVIVRWLSGDPFQHAVVVLDFFPAPELRVSADVAGSAIVDCASRTVRAISDQNGRAVFSIVGAAGGAAPCAGAGCPRVKIYADGVLLSEARVAAFDLDGSSGVGVADEALWLADFGTGLDRMRSDYNGDGTVGVADLALWLGRFGSGGSGQSGSVYCP